MNSFVLFAAAVAFLLHVVYSIPAFQHSGHQGHHGSAIEDILEVNKYMDQELFEGDIEYGPANSEIQNGLTQNKTLRWPGKVVHFVISGFSAAQTSLIRDAAREIEKNTCIQMKEHTWESTPEDFINVIDGSGCWSFIGKQGGMQELSLTSNGCLNKGTPIHEFIHALGVYHEQSRADRDEYIDVHWDNIDNGRSNNFQKFQTDSMGVEYDPKSVMQYSETAFTRNGKNTLSWKKDPSLSLGGHSLTALDIKQLNLFYECDGHVTTKKPTTKKTTTTTTTKATTTKPKTTKPKTTKTTTTKSTTTKSTTTKATTTKSTTTKPKTTKATTTKSKTTTTRGPSTVCGDTRFECVYAYYKRSLCDMGWYKGINLKVECRQTCRQCYGGNSIQCGNFKDNEHFGCHEKKIEGRCTTKNSYALRFEMKENCPRSCCDIGRLYW